MASLFSDLGSGGVVSALGDIASSYLSYKAQGKAADTQAKALERARKFTFENLNPDVVNAQAQQADIERAKQRLALQATIDPALAELRQQSQRQLLDQSAKIGTGSAADLGELAASNAISSNDQTTALKNRLIDSALAELNAGATLPPDIQAELVKAGLEKSGMVTGGVTPSGVGGTLVRKEIGAGANALRQQRLANANSLITQASNLDTQRQQILASLFPSLNAMQLNNLNASGGAFNLANAATPDVGLSGSNIAGLWLSRVGAVNNLNNQLATVEANKVLGQAGSVNQGIGAGASLVDKGLTFL